MTDVRVAIGLGSNLGNRPAQISFAWEALGELLTGAACSRVYETRPLHVESQPDFLNACCAGLTGLPATALLGELKAIERAAGRTDDERWGPRALDLDLLLYGDDVIDEAGLRVPHPRMHERAFVLVPLVELLPDWTHPALGRTVTELAADVSRDGVRLFEHGTDSTPPASDEPSGVRQ